MIRVQVGIFISFLIHLTFLWDISIASLWPHKPHQTLGHHLKTQEG